MQPRDYFPLGKAQGEAFCNREAETTWLASNIQACRHSLLIAPRRFGKSSLADKAVAMSSWPVVTLNFNICADENDVETLIRQGVSNLISIALGPVEKLINSIKNYVSNLIPTVHIGPRYAYLELTANTPNVSASANVEEALSLIERLLAEKKQPAIMVLDEFQAVGLIAKGRGVEAAIRNVAQETKFLRIIFSGSNRSLLKIMFEDEGRPLYKLCRKLHLERIEKTHYQKHLDQAAHLMWKKSLNETVFKHIMFLSEQHPYYVNYLCDVLWTECTSLPTVTNVEHAWHAVVEEEKSDANAEIANLSFGQKKVLRHIATHPVDGLLSASTIKAIGMAQSSIASAIEGLVEKDIVEKQAKAYVIINPIIKWLLRDGVDKVFLNA